MRYWEEHPYPRPPESGPSGREVAGAVWLAVGIGAVLWALLRNPAPAEPGPDRSRFWPGRN